jgi:hypothetical protein
MKSFRQFITEMAKPNQKINDTVFYHGNSRGHDEAVSIARDGLNPAGNGKQSGGMLKPMEGKVYATPHIHYAQIYALGGDIAGSTGYYNPERAKKEAEHGHVFAFSGSKISDVHPDEDSVGQLYGTNKGPHWLNHLVDKHMTPHTRKKAREGEYSHYANIGKKMQKHLSDDQKLDLINNHGAHAAITGNIKPDRVFRIHKSKIPELKRDGSNFFDHAEELDIDELAKGNAVRK